MDDFNGFETPQKMMRKIGWFRYIHVYSQTLIQRPPLGEGKSGLYSKVVFISRGPDSETTGLYII